MTAFPFVTPLLTLSDCRRPCGPRRETGERRSPCVMREPRNADEGVRRRFRWHLHDCPRGILSGPCAASLGNLACTTRHNEVCRAADEDGNGGCGGLGEVWNVSKLCILEVVRSNHRSQISTTKRKEGWEEFDRTWRTYVPVGISSSERFPRERISVSREFEVLRSM